MEAPKHFKFKELYKRRREAIDINLRRQKQVRFIRNARLEKLQLENIRGMDEDSANKEMMRLDGISKGLGYELPEQTRKQKLVYGRAENIRNMQLMPGFSVINSLNNLNDNIMGINNMLPFNKRLYQFIIPDISKLNREGFVSDQVLVIDTDKNEYALYDIDDLMDEFPVETQSQMNGYIRRVYINDRIILSYVNNKDSMFMSKINKLNDIAKPVDSFSDFDNMIVTKAITGTGTGTGIKDETDDEYETTDEEKLGSVPSSEPIIPSIIPESKKTGSGPKIEVEEPSSSEYTAEQFKEDEKEQKKKEDLTSSSKQKKIQRLKTIADMVTGISSAKIGNVKYKGTAAYYKNAITMFKNKIPFDNHYFIQPLHVTITEPTSKNYMRFIKCINPIFTNLKNTSQFFYGSIGYLDAAFSFAVEPIDGLTKSVDIGINQDLSNLVTVYDKYLSAFTVTFSILFLEPNVTIINAFKRINPGSEIIPKSFMNIKLENETLYETLVLDTVIKNIEEHYKNVQHPYSILKMILSYSSNFYKKFGTIEMFQKQYDEYETKINQLKLSIVKNRKKIVSTKLKGSDLYRHINVLNKNIDKYTTEIKTISKNIESYAYYVISIRVLAEKYKNNEKYIPTYNKNLFK